MNKTEIKYLFLIIVIFIAACIETDIYLPAFADMMLFFSASEKQIQSLLTWNFIGICISGPLYGPISDAIGRKKPLLIALALFLIGSLITIVSQDFNDMLIGRFLQGLGSGGCFTLGTAIIFDAFQDKKAIKAVNQLNLIIPFIMAIAPIAGGYLNNTFGFRSNFLVIAIFVLASLIICLLSFDETLPKEKRQSLDIRKILSDFKKALTNVPFWQTTLIISLLFAGYMVFLSGSAVLFVVEFGVKKEIFPAYQAAVLIAWLIASLTNTKAVNKLGINRIKIISTSLIALGAIGFGISALVAPTNPYSITTVVLFYTFGVNWIMSVYFPEGMEVLPDIKGITASLLTSARLLITALIVGFSGLIYNGTIYPMVAVLIGITLAVIPTILLYERARKPLQE